MNLATILYVHTLSRAIEAHQRALSYPAGSYQRARWMAHADGLCESTSTLADSMPVVYAVPYPAPDL